MKNKTVLILIVISLLVAAIAGAGSYLFYVSPYNHTKLSTKVATNVSSKVVQTSIAKPDKLFGWKFPIAKFPLTGSNGNLIAYSSIRDPGGIPQGLPVRLQIPVIGVDSAIEDALITPDGRMDVPAGSVNVAWFALGPHPGQVGSAVIGGHYGIQNGVPFVFYQLNKVKIGDKVYIVDDKNTTLAFVVRSIKSFDRNGDSTSVFTSSDGIAHLNLITCEGIWNQVNGSYPQRLVVFTDAIPAEGSVKVNKQAAVPNAPKITTTLTPTISSSSGSTLTPTPTEKIVKQSSNKTSTIPYPTLILSIQALYANPLDGIITSVLLLAIAFVIFKIVRR